MTLLIILVCLGLERYVSVIGTQLRRFNWINWYLKESHKRIGNTGLWRDYLAMVTMVIPILIIVAIVYFLFSYWLGDVGRFLIGAFVLLYCLGPFDLYHKVTEYLNAASKNDQEKAKQYASELLEGKLPEDEKQTEGAIISRLLWQMNENVFAVLFWFIILGPVGTVMYRMVVLLSKAVQRDKDQYANLVDAFIQIQGILDWVPARLTSLGYALVGNFSETFGYWLDYVFSGWNKNHAILTECGRVTQRFQQDTELKPENTRATLVLLDRVLIIYIIVVALFALGTWLHVV